MSLLAQTHQWLPTFLTITSYLSQLVLKGPQDPWPSHWLSIIPHSLLRPFTVAFSLSPKSSLGGFYSDLCSNVSSSEKASLPTHTKTVAPPQSLEDPHLASFLPYIIIVKSKMLTAYCLPQQNVSAFLYLTMHSIYPQGLEKVPVAQQCLINTC